MPKLRINRALAAAGVASRRGAEALVTAGRVTINGRRVTDLAVQVDPERDILAVDGKRLKITIEHFYYIYHKPRGQICSQQDERGRSCLGDVTRNLRGQPQTVGRLDRDSEGLLVLTNDGSLAHRLTHPRYGVKKLYQITIAPELQDQDARQMVRGVTLDDGPARFLSVELNGGEPGRSRLELTVDEGRNRLIRRVCETLGYRVLRLKRVRLATLALGRLKLGEVRQLSSAEVAELKRQVGLAELPLRHKPRAPDPGLVRWPTSPAAHNSEWHPPLPKTLVRATGYGDMLRLLKKGRRSVVLGG